MSTIEVGELLYDHTVKLAGMMEYGVSFESLMAGAAALPTEGARFDVVFEGTSIGPRRVAERPRLGGVNAFTVVPSWSEQ